jgi:hypothetical protein
VAFASIPDKAFVELDAEFAQKIAIFGAEDDVNDDPAERLRHCGIMAKETRR